MASQPSELQDDTHFRILRLLHDNPQWSQRELARAVGISNGGLHYVLNALVERGLIKLGNFSLSQDKRRYAYVWAPKGIAEKAATTRRLLARKVAECDALRAKIDTLRDEPGLKGSDKPSHHG